jgi:hypothetical protein
MSLTPGGHPVPEYELVQLLGRGAFGEVWKALGPGGVAVAMKFIRLDQLISEVEIRSLGLMKNLHHPNLIGLSGIWQREDLLVIAMELGDQTLRDRLIEAQEQGLAAIPAAELHEYLRDVARGIDHLNSIQIVHRDIKPQNILLMGGGAKVADFGLAKLMERTLAKSSGAMTPSYAAPELFKGQVSGQADQYALAVSYCELRGGRMPFEGGIEELMRSHLFDPPNLAMLPEEERPVVARALAKDPAARWPDCRAFVRALQQVSAAPEDRQGHLSHPGLPVPARKEKGRAGRRMVWLVAAAVLLGGAAVFLWHLLAGQDPLVDLRRQEIEREVAFLRSQEPVVIRSHPPGYKLVDVLEPDDNSAFDVLSDDRVVDLRLWQEVPPDKLHELQSAVNITRRLRLKKTRPARTMEFQGRTSGLELFQTCASLYPFRVTGQTADTFVGTDRMKVRKLTVDVSTVAENTEFDLRVVGTYWNSLQTEQELWFGIIGYERSFKVSLLMLFPPEKPFSEYKLMVARTVKDLPAPYTGPKILLAGAQRDWLYWEVPNPGGGYVYRLHWKW